MKACYKLLLNIFIKIHNFSYQAISVLVFKIGDGIHPKHKIMNYHQFFVDHVDENDLILDLGCGNGFLTFDVAKKAKQVVGIDIDEKNIKFAKEKYQKSNLEFLIGDILTYKIPNHFDKIILSNVLEHIENRIDFLKHLTFFSGIILLRVPMINRDWLDIYKKEQGFEYRLDKTHFIEYTTDELTQELKSSGWILKNYSIQFGELWGVVEKIKD